MEKMETACSSGHGTHADIVRVPGRQAESYLLAVRLSVEQLPLVKCLHIHRHAICATNQYYFLDNSIHSDTRLEQHGKYHSKMVCGSDYAARISHHNPTLRSVN